ncbi:MAG: hypothetical protein SFX73_18035 [Kofleriaceae bacterium]|nr:hypothetical protein [Kofleriaceae bacterium]
MHRSVSEARQAFDAYVRLEPRLAALWEACEDAAPPGPADDGDEIDPYELDGEGADAAEVAWCAEEYFLHHVKSKLIALVGTHRIRGPRELQSNAAYETIYDLLINWALNRACPCCSEPDTAPWRMDAARG